MIDLAPEHLEKVRSILRQHVPQCEVRAFGSRVNCTAKDYSDLDLAVVCSEKLSDDTLRHLKEAFEESDLPFRVDVLDWHAISPEFREVVEKEYEIVHGLKNGGMADNWRTTGLGGVLAFVNGKSSPDREDGLPFAVYGSNGVIGYTREVNADVGTIVIGRVGSYCGSLHFSPQRSWVTDNAIRANALGENDSLFLFYLLKTLNLNNLRAGSGQPLLNQSILSAVEVTIPGPPQQRAIAHILGTLDDKIELNRRMNETLEAMARALFRSWFVDFDPVRAKAEGHQPFGMDAETATLFPDSFQDSPLGKIPKGWAVRKLGDVAGVNERAVSADYPHRVVQYVEISSVAKGRLLGATDYGLADAPSRAKRLVCHGDTVWSCVRPNREAYFFVHEPASNLVVSTGFAVLTPKEIPATYLYAWVTTQDFVEYLSYSADGSAYPAVRPDRFSDSQMLVPSAAILQRFEQMAGPFRDRIAKNDKETIALAGIRDALLPKLISGEIRVRDAEKEVEKTL